MYEWPLIPIPNVWATDNGNLLKLATRCCSFITHLLREKEVGLESRIIWHRPEETSSTSTWVHLQSVEITENPDHLKPNELWRVLVRLKTHFSSYSRVQGATPLVMIFAPYQSYNLDKIATAALFLLMDGLFTHAQAFKEEGNTMITIAGTFAARLPIHHFISAIPNPYEEEDKERAKLREREREILHRIS